MTALEREDNARQRRGFSPARQPVGQQRAIVAAELMTDDKARAVANVVLASAGVAAAYVIMTTPPLRRLAFKAVQVWLGASLPVFLMTQAREAWVESGSRHA